MNLLPIIFVVLFFVQNLSFFILCEKIVSPKGGLPYYFLVSIINALGFSLLFYHIPEHLIYIYIGMCFVYILEGLILFSSTPLATVAVTLTLPFHLIALRYIGIATFALISDSSLDATSTSVQSAWHSLNIASALSTVFILVLLAFIPTNYFTIIIKSLSKITVFLVLEAIVLANLIFNVIFLSYNVPSVAHSLQQLTFAISGMIILYTGLFVLIGFEMMESHKKNLQTRLLRESTFKDSQLVRYKVALEVDCNTDTIITLARYGEPVSESKKETGYSQYIRSLIAKNVYDADLEMALEKTSLKHIFQKLDMGITDYSFDYRATDGGREITWYRVSVQITADKVNNLVHAFLSSEDVHEEKLVEFQLKNQAERDPLVGSYNRMAAINLIDSYLNSHYSGSLFMIDLDNFKNINDTFGHAYGDDVLIQTYKHLAHIFRDDDIIGRLGGDEFIVFIKAAINKDLLESKANSICSALNQTYTENGVSITVSSSVGISFAPTHGDNFNSLFESADIAMYSAKESGKNSYKFFSEALPRLHKNITRNDALSDSDHQ